MVTPPDSLEIGPFQIYLYSLFILIGIAAGYTLARPAARQIKLPLEALQVSLFFGVIPGLVGARLYHVVDQWGLYAGQPLEALAVWNGGLGILGGLAGGAIGLAYFCRRYQVPFLRLLDVWAPSVLLAQAIGRFGNWTNQEAFGPPTDGPFKVFIDPAHRPAEYLGSEYFHPTFFYESAFDLVGVVALVALRPGWLKQPGKVFGAYLVWYSIGRFLVEFYRFDTAKLGSLKVGHLVAVALIGIGVWLVTRPGRRAR